MTRHPRLALVCNALGFQCVWFATVAGAGAGHGWAGPLAAALFAFLTVAFFGRARADLLLLAVAIPFGFLLDTLWVKLGLMRFAEPWPLAGWAPVWILALWVGFTMTVNHSLAGLADRLWLAVALGAAGGPLAYFAAERAFGAVELLAPTGVVILALGAAWAATVPMLLVLGQRLQPTPPAVGVAGVH